MRRAAAPLALAFLLAACGGTHTASGLTLLRYGPMTGTPAALANGTLRFLSGCTILENIDPNGAPKGQVILWPPGTDIVVRDGLTHVAVGGTLATDGDEVQLGGGQYSDQAWVEHMVGDVKACRSDRYWLASSMSVQGRASSVQGRARSSQAPASSSQAPATSSDRWLASGM